MSRRFAIACGLGWLVGCGVADTGILLQPPPPAIGADAGRVLSGSLEIRVSDFGRVPLGGVFTGTLEMIISDPTAGTTVEMQPIEGSQSFSLAELEPGDVFSFPAAGTKTETVEFRPRSGAQQATIRFQRCDAQGACELVAKTINGFGVEPAFSCRGGDFGPVVLGECLRGEVVCVNDTQIDLTTRGIVLSGSPAFSPSQHPDRDVLAGDSTRFGLEFCPQEFGAAVADLSISVPLSGGQNVTHRQLIGEGISTNEECVLDVPEWVDFGAVSVGEVGVLQIAIVNLGFAPCAVRVDGPDASSDPAYQAPFTPTEAVLETGATLQVEVHFTPLYGGSHRGRLSLFVPGLGARQVELYGEGIEGPRFGYTIVTTPGPLSLAGGEPLSFSDSDDGFATISIGFPFRFAGVPVSTAFVSTNGLIAFDDSDGTESILNGAIPTPGVPNGFIAWWWDDLDLDNPQGPLTSATTTITGVAPNRVRVFSFDDVSRFGGNDISTVDAEVRLFETYDIIEVHYGSISVGTNDFSASAGWESPSGADGEDTFGCSPSCSEQDWLSDTIMSYLPN